LKVVPLVDKVVVLGDFNFEFGRNWESSASAVGRHHLHHDKAASDNGERFLDLAGSFGLYVANTFFPNRLGHLVTWFHPLTKRWYVKDYIMCSRSLICGGARLQGLYLSAMAITTIGCWSSTCSCI
jgi:hypothetical protein